MDAQAILQEHRGRVRAIAWALSARLPANESMDDLIQEGMLALFLAIERYREQPDCTFWSYAHTRVRGAMLDYMRMKGPVSRQNYRQSSKFAKMKTQLQHELLREPTDGELAEALELTALEFTETQRLSLVSFQSIEVSNSDEDGFKTAAESLLDWHLQAADEGSDPETLLTEKRRIHALIRRVAELSERNQEVARLILEEDLTLKEISKRLGVTESRVCQLRGYIVEELSRSLRDH